MEPLEIEGREQVQLTMLLDQKLGLTFTEQLERSTETALRPQRSLGNHALNPMLAGGKTDDLRRLTIAQS
jgi:hypothetical protein